MAFPDGEAWLREILVHSILLSLPNCFAIASIEAVAHYAEIVVGCSAF